MDHYIALAYFTAGVSLLVGMGGLCRDWRSVPHRVFALGMVVLAVEAAVVGASIGVPVGRYLFWAGVGQVAGSLVYAAWLVFSVVFARSNYLELLSRWKWVVAFSIAVPLLLVLGFRGAFFAGQIFDASRWYVLPLGWSGYLWHICAIGLSVMVIMNLERTLRHSTGHTRWQIKFMLLGIGGIFLVRLFIDSQGLLFRSVNSELDMLKVGALLVGNVLVSVSLFRGNPLETSVYLSHKFLYNSLTILIIGIYFILVAVVSWLSSRFYDVSTINVVIFLVFLGLLGMATYLLSDRMRLKRKRFISHHLKRSLYDYQSIWEAFTQQTASVTNASDLCSETVKIISRTLEILSVTVWLVDEEQESLSFGGSTALTAEQASGVKFAGRNGEKLIRAMAGQEMPVDLEKHEDDWVGDLMQSYDDETKEGRIRYCVPMRASGRLAGVMTLSSKVFYEPLSFEDSELLKTIADQAAALLLNIELSERLRRAREMEAFRDMSAFFIHDLKNLANKLSLVTQNLPKHLDNPEFREDALRTISQSVVKINTMSSRLSLVSSKLELHLGEEDLEEFIRQSLAGLNGFIKVAVRMELGHTGTVLMDPGEMKKVVDNLLLNAQEATNGAGEITVRTGRSARWAEYSVADNGCGMTRDFVERRLFRPFQTSKQKGMGIGLFHCKAIVEAHGGKIEVETEEGKGSTFRVLLPVRS